MYSLGSSQEHPGSRFRPLRLNPFFFELGTSLKRHIAVLSDALAELMPTEAMIGPLMRRAVEATYLEREWDIESGLPIDGVAPAWPTVLDFAAQVRLLAQSLNYGPEVSANYRGGSGEPRFSLCRCNLPGYLQSRRQCPHRRTLPGRSGRDRRGRRPAPSEVNVRAFVMTLLLSRLRAVQGVRGHGPAAAAAMPIIAQAAAQREPLPGFSPATTVGEPQYLAAHKHTRKGRRKRRREGRTVVAGAPLAHPVQAAGTLPVATGSSLVRGADYEDMIKRAPRRWLVVVEEAHNVLDRSFEVRRTGG